MRIVRSRLQGTLLQGTLLHASKIPSRIGTAANENRIKDILELHRR